MKKLIVLLFLVFFLFGFKNSSDALESSNIPENCRDYMSYCLKQKPRNYCTDITESYLYCWTGCKELLKLSDNFCRKTCSCDLSLRWKFYWINNFGVCFYDIESITWSSTWLSKRVAKVWWKIIYTEKGKEEMARNFGEKYKKIDYSLALNEFDCATKKVRDLELYNYFLDGEVVENHTYSSSWKSIIPESSLEALFNELCSKKNK
uniref:Surface-adhesin protein E-like domain-containing protein n=1 Tax=Dictyoglomus turgidum TaxID=513050 RepID=A0A7C3SNJ7_9BACT